MADSFLERDEAWICLARTLLMDWECIVTGSHDTATAWAQNSNWLFYMGEE